MNASYYIVVPAALVTAYQGQQKGENVFWARQTLDGRYVMGCAAVSEFEDWFLSHSVSVDLLPREAFAEDPDTGLLAAITTTTATTTTTTTTTGTTGLL